MGESIGSREERANHPLRELVDLTLSTVPAGNVNVSKDGIWVRFREAGNLHVYPTLGIIEASREQILDKGRVLAEAYRSAGYAVYEVVVR